MVWVQMHWRIFANIFPQTARGWGEWYFLTIWVTGNLKKGSVLWR